MIVTRTVRPTFIVFRTFTDVHGREKKERKVYLSEHGAYMQAGRWAVFQVRDRLPMDENGQCVACEALAGLSHDPESGPRRCKWHSDSGFQKRVRRAARWLRWLDRKEAANG